MSAASKSSSRLSVGCAVLLVGAMGPVLAHAQEAPVATAPADLQDVSLEDLFAQEVSSVAKKPQNLKEASAAVFVIGREDIRRSGATALPDLLRMVPGAEVAQLPNANDAVSVRGFNSLFSSKLLILLDGRSIYNPAVSGVTWSSQLVPVEDIERIEVVRGPGASLWGVNAMNGVINIITKHAIDSLGGAATAQVVSDGDWRAYLRQGVQLGDAGTLRISGQLRREHNPVDYVGRRADEYYNGSYAGLRYDVDVTDRDAVTLQADYVHDESGNSFGIPNSFQFLRVDMERITTLGRWTRTGDEGVRTSLQAYYDRQSGLYGPSRNLTEAWDLDFSRRQPLGEHHDLVWGLGLRRTSVKTRDMPYPSDVQQNWYSGYIQDEATFLDKRLHVTVGAKIEHNQFANVQVQPTLRAIWVDPHGWSAWAAASRAARTPSNIEVNTHVDLDPTGFVVALPGKAAPETMDAYEVGWRGPLSDKVQLDVTAFYNRYERLIADVGQLEFPDGRPAFIFRPANATRARSYGVEAELDAHLTRRWTVKTGLSALHLRVDDTALPSFSFGALQPPQSPHYQVSVRSLWDVRDDLDFDVSFRRVSSLSGGVGDAYNDLGVRLAWRPSPRFEIGLLGEHLLDKERVEMSAAQGDVTNPLPIVQRQVRISFSARY